MNRGAPTLQQAPGNHSTSERGRGAREGFTLIELMVALALSAILSIMIMMISTGAQETYTATLRKVEIYNRFRLALNTLTEDFAAWIPTQEMEFYTDGKGGAGRRNFHFESGEQVPDTSDSYGPGVVNGGTPGYDEYAHIVQLHYLSNEIEQYNRGDPSYKRHDAYQVYFRTMTYIEGQNREANVEYMLVDPGRPKSEWKNGLPPPPRKYGDGSGQELGREKIRDLALYKVVRFFRIDEDLITKPHLYPVERRVVEVATNVTDFRVEYLSENPFGRSSKNPPMFRTPEEDYSNKFGELAVRAKKGKTPRNGAKYTKVFGYGSVMLDRKFPKATAESAVWGDDKLRNSTKKPQPVRVGFRGSSVINFGEIVPGDRVYIFTDTERGGRKAGGNVAGRLAAFPSGDYTVKTNLNGMLEFVEDIDCSLWNGKDQSGILYKVAFMPTSLRITLRMVDDEGLNPKTMQQVIWLRRRSR